MKSVFFVILCGAMLIKSSDAIAHDGNSKCSVPLSTILVQAEENSNLTDSAKEIEGSLKNIYANGGCLQLISTQGLSNSIFIRGSLFYIEKLPSFKQDQYQDYLFGFLNSRESFEIFSSYVGLEGVNVHLAVDTMSLAAGVVFDSTEHFSEGLSKVVQPGQVAKVNYIVYPSAISREGLKKFNATLVHEGRHVSDILDGQMISKESVLEKVLFADIADGLIKDHPLLEADYLRIRRLYDDLYYILTEVPAIADEVRELNRTHDENASLNSLFAIRLNSQVLGLVKAMTTLSNAQREMICKLVSQNSEELYQSDYFQFSMKYCAEEGLTELTNLYGVMCASSPDTQYLVEVSKSNGKLEVVSHGAFPELENEVNSVLSRNDQEETFDLIWQGPDQSSDQCFATLVSSFRPSGFNCATHAPPICRNGRLVLKTDRNGCSVPVCESN